MIYYLRTRYLGCFLSALILCLSLACRCGAADPAETSAQPPETALEITTNTEGISIYAMNTQADELFTKLAKQSGIGIIIDDTVGRRDGGKFTSRVITINLTNKKVSEIIEKICTAYGLSYSRVGDVFMISEGIPKNPSSYLMSDIDSVTTEYVVSSRAKSLLPVFLQDHVKVNEGQNAVILSAPKEVLAKFREDVKQFDVPAAQIMIDVVMVELTDSASKQLGFDWLWSNAGKSVSISPGSDLIYQSLGTLTKAFSATLTALVESGQARVNANPRIATISGQTASIFVGRQRYLSQSVDNKNYIDAGITLSMTPWTGGNGEIITEVHPEVSVMSALGRQDTQRIPLRWLAADKALGLLPNFLVRCLRADKDNNQLLFSGSPEFADKLRADLMVIDRPTRTVMVEASLVEVSSTVDIDSALALGYRNAELSAALDVPRLQFGIAKSQVSPAEFNATLDALTTSGAARSVSSAKLSAVSGEQGTIFVGVDRYIQVRDRYAQRDTVIPVKSGLSLTMKPVVTGGQVRLDLSVEISNINVVDPATNLPVVDTRKASGTFQVRSGEPIVIGGLEALQNQMTRRRIPVLGYVPIVGGLFTTRVKQRQNSRLMLLLTPRIVEDTVAKDNS